MDTTPNAPPPEAAAAPSSPPPPGRRRAKLAVAALVVVAGATAGLISYLRSLDYETTDDAFLEAHLVQLASRVEAPVVRVHVRDNQEVLAGAPLVDLDDRDFQVRLDDAKAFARAAEGRVKQALAQIDVAKAAAAQARADLAATESDDELARADLRRYQALPPRAVAEQLVDKAVAAARSAAARKEAALQKSASAEAQLALAGALSSTGEAELEKARVAVRQRELEVSYTTIRAPQDGRVARKAVEPGNHVKAGQALLALVSREVWVVANFKETQLARIRPGQPVDLHVDAFPDRLLRGHVDSIQAGTGARFSLFPPENATGNYVKVVQRVPVKIVLDETDGLASVLAPGMSVIPEVRIR
jgi:membrane fusion protein (multidrug efflux system)